LFIVMKEGDCCLTKYNACSDDGRVGGRIRSGRGLPRRSCRRSSGEAAAWQDRFEVSSHPWRRSARRPCFAAEFDEGGLHRHFLPQRFDSGEAGNCKGRKSDPHNGFHARTIALLACR
jgi:hypothetical protein